MEDFFAHASVAMHLVGADGSILRANQAELDLLGYAPEEYIGQHIAAFHEDAVALQAILSRLHSGERLDRFPARLRARDGSIREVLISSSPRFIDGHFSNTRCITVDVTEQRRLDREAREREDQLRDLLNALPVAIYTTDADGRITFFNEAATVFAGRRPVLGDKWCVTWKLFHLDGRPMPHEACPMAVALRERRSVRGAEAVAERPDGSRIIFTPFPTPLFDAQGTLVGAVNMLVDITDRKQAEQALRDLNEALEEHARERTRQVQDAFLRLHRSERNFALLIDSVTDYAIYMLDPDGHVVSWNAGAERIKGYRAGEIIGRSFACFYTHEDRYAGLPQRALATARREGRYEAEGWRVRKDGTRFWANVLLDPVYDEGELIGYAKVTRDVTAQKNAQRALADSERRVRGVIDTALDAFVQLDATGVILEWNPRAEAMYGWRRDEALGRRLDDLIFAPAERDAFRQGLPGHTTASTPSRDQVRQIRSRRRDGRELVVEMSSSVLHLDQGRLYNVFLRDLTEKIQTETQLRQAQKMEAVGKLTGGIAHDFNNLLQGIIGSLDLLELRVQSGRTDGLDRLLHGAQESAKRAAALTHRLLAFSRRQPLDPHPVDVGPLVASMEELLRRTMGERIAIELLAEAQGLVAMCDPNQLESALLNLCINARDAMPQGGRLTIRTGETVIAEDDVRATEAVDLAPGRYIHVEVADTGVGMTADVVEHVFEPFFTTKPSGQGTGLGLSMVYGFARQSKGHCEIDSAPGAGTRVRLYLPCHVGTVPVAEAGGQPVGPDPGNGETVLVVEDEAVVREVVVQVLHQLGYAAIEASDAEQAIGLLASHPVELLVTDIGLPGLDGRQLADAARQTRPELKVLLMTGYAAGAASPDGFLAPGMALITKPFTTSALAQRVRDMLAPA
ncbi:PAS domain S-box protein [Fulvimonas yonginensis]|uniref:histidine kinase n=1 Tax=Fulvimonas yonginensis TaxID=1495200 RepID=A0ABU8JA04_9GAMM